MNFFLGIFASSSKFSPCALVFLGLSFWETMSKKQACNTATLHAASHVEAKNTDNQSEVKEASPPALTCNTAVADKETFSSQQKGKKEQEMLLAADCKSCNSSSIGRTEKFETLVGQHSDSPQRNSDCLQSPSVEAAFHTQTNEDSKEEKEVEEEVKMNYFRKRFSFVGSPAAIPLPSTAAVTTSESILRDVRSRRRRGHLDNVDEPPTTRLVGERRRRRSSANDFALPDPNPSSIVEKYCSHPDGEDNQQQNIEVIVAFSHIFYPPSIGIVFLFLADDIQFDHQATRAVHSG